MASVEEVEVLSKDEILENGEEEEVEVLEDGSNKDPAKKKKKKKKKKSIGYLLSLFL